MGAVVKINSHKFIFIKYNIYYHHSKLSEMVFTPDDPMDPDPNIPPGQKPPDRSPANRECSASPWAHANRPSQRRDPHGWTYNHMLGILQHASGCSTCGAYVTHFMESQCRILTKTHHLLMLSTAKTPKWSRSRYIMILLRIKSAPKRMPLITKFPRTSSRQ